MQLTQIILIRHGETAYNAEHRLQGHLDIDLNKKGIAQAQATAERLKTEAFSVLYSSDLKRAYHTAQIIAGQTGHEIITDPQLRELNGGVLEGLNKDEMITRYPEVYRGFKSGDPTYVIPNGESFQMRYDRAVTCLNQIAEKHTGETVVVVTHGGIIDSIFRYVIDIPIVFDRRFSIHNASINIFQVQQGRWRLFTWGDIYHLRGLDVELKTVM
ncbi:MAG: histidine phosphatase family protein [Gemmatimonadetes bacterium]|nr:MAG: histidine phosphatase family protein [Gemmatimonadota bacterium]